MAPAVPLAARGGAARSGAAAAPPPPHGSLWARARSWAARYLHWARGYALWALYNAVGAALATPLLIRHLGQLLLRPRQTLHRKDRTQLVLPDPLPGLIHEFIDAAPGIMLHAVRTERRSGKPLMLFLHGFPESWFSWRHQMAAFRDSHECVAVELRGYGLSSRPEGRAAYSIDALAADIQAVARRLLEEAGQEQLVLVGHDWGGNVAWVTAALAPELVRRLVVLCCPHPACFRRNMDLNQFKRSWYVFAFQMPWLPEAHIAANDYDFLRAAFTEEPFGVQTPGMFTEENLERYKQALGWPGAATAAVNFYRALVDVMTRTPLPALQRATRRRLPMPTLLLWGEKDPALGQQLMRGTERYVESLRVEVLQGCSHWAQQDQPQRVNALMAEFLAE